MVKLLEAISKPCLLARMGPGVTIRVTAGSTILQDGCVLLPLHLNGLVFDLVEVILLHLNQAGQDPPIYVIGPHAKAAFAFANVYSNW